ncbi:MAG: hypothetical protein N4J56_001127 [Chroococcidiopsis sp. SAG 2025]|uniref:hypothetical protein n=1 Tax=Chroococcidiopsis sp. SAG 2025 TaxID=171389 RepID=UPI002936E007|nr:hypothetical protein [Chroococcidiopsis sp. SAG 2025]MDV2991473.1 hypothetical protein [Chroococcidiopsis sp. SAG 2025]
MSTSESNSFEPENDGSSGDANDLLLQSPFGRLSEVLDVEDLANIFSGVGDAADSSNTENPFAGDNPNSESDLAYGGNPFAGDNFWNIFAGGVNPGAGDNPFTSAESPLASEDNTTSSDNLVPTQNDLSSTDLNNLLQQSPFGPLSEVLGDEGLTTIFSGVGTPPEGSTVSSADSNNPPTGSGDSNPFAGGNNPFINTDSLSTSGSSTYHDNNNSITGSGNWIFVNGDWQQLIDSNSSSEGNSPFGNDTTLQGAIAYFRGNGLTTDNNSSSTDSNSNLAFNNLPIPINNSDWLKSLTDLADSESAASATNNRTIGNGNWHFGSGNEVVGNGNWLFASYNDLLGNGNWYYDNDNATVGNGNWYFGTENATIGNGNWLFANANESIGNGNWYFDDANKTVGNGNWHFGSDNATIGNGNWYFGSGNATIGNSNRFSGNDNLVIGNPLANGFKEIGDGKLVIGNSDWTFVTDRNAISDEVDSLLTSSLGNFYNSDADSNQVSQGIDSLIDRVGKDFLSLLGSGWNSESSTTAPSIDINESIFSDRPANTELDISINSLAEQIKQDLLTSLGSGSPAGQTELTQTTEGNLFNSENFLAAFNSDLTTTN